MKQIPTFTVTRCYETSYAYFFEAMAFLVGIEKLHSAFCSVILCIYTSDFILPKLHIYLGELGKERNGTERKIRYVCLLLAVYSKKKKKKSFI